MAVQGINQNSKKGGFCEEFLCENDFEAVLATSVVMTMVPVFLS